MELGLSLGFGRREEEEVEEEEEEDRSYCEPPLQLSLLPSVPLPRHPSSSSSQLGFPWKTDNNNNVGFDVNRIPSSAEEGSDPISTVSSFPTDFSAMAVVRARSEGGPEPEPERASDEEENGSARKKLRLSKEQSAFLEESFKEHNTLNPKQKVALAKQLNLRPRQVEVWFQNRRARTKLKQTEVECEYLKRCCETLTEENRRMQKEVTDLRALKTPSNPFFMQLPATTLSMCPSCERMTTTASSTGVASASAGHNSNSNKSSNSFASLFGKKPKFYPFVPHPATSPAS